MTEQSDYLVVGSGIAGLSFALHAAKTGSVMILTKKLRADTNTNHAQGGIAAVMDKRDSFDLHIGDTLAAGVGLCHREAVEAIVREAPEMIRDLADWGVHFTMERSAPDTYALGREGGHSRHRIIHSKDCTGMAIEQALLEQIRTHPNIRILENHMAVELITEHHLGHPDADDLNCWGVYALNAETGEVKTYLAQITLLCTGGTGQVYLHTTNPDIATGDGISMAYRAGAEIANLEFMQFHPTTLWHPDGNSFLISEAVRGFGGKLRTAEGHEFMFQYHDQGDLAPRDVVARAIDTEMKLRGDDCVYLDVTHLPALKIMDRFPHIYRHLLDFKIDMTKEPVPVVPAAHYICGGVLTNLQGRTHIRRLYASGEVACTGVHGANRLASNSLLEALVFSKQAFLASRQEMIHARTALPKPPSWDDSDVEDQEEWVLISHDREEVRRLMWNYVGIVRSDKRLLRAQRRIQLISDEVESFYKRTRVTFPLLELRNICCTALLIIQAALHRKESRGLHFTTDYPERDDVHWHGDTLQARHKTTFRPLPHHEP